MSRWLKLVLWANLLVMTGLVFAYPHLTISPGKLIPGHEKLETDCFACHAPFTGSSSALCSDCHKPAEIGVKTTTGAPVAHPVPKTPFHQKLVAQDCVSCHSDHEGVSRFRTMSKFKHALLNAETRKECSSCHKGPTDTLHKTVQASNCSACHSDERWKPATFSHATLSQEVRAQCVTCHKGPTDTLHKNVASMACSSCHNEVKWKPSTFSHKALDPAVRTQCVTCHKGPTDTLHKNVASVPCGTCHSEDKWKPATFSHAALAPAMRAQCATCHKGPTDTLHKNAANTPCSSCHSETKWKPATFNHSKWFVLDRDHNVACTTCHKTPDYKQYTCYGCHEHTEANMARKHQKEGIRDFSNCVRCHKSADEHDIRNPDGGGQWFERKGKDKGKKDDDDD